MSKENCGCRVRHIGSPRSIGHKIMECSVHAAAFKMREALKNALVNLRDYLRECGPCDHAVNICVCGLAADIEAVARALALAEGKEADHDKLKD